MSLLEGQIFEGEVGSFGHDAPHEKWIVVQSFGKLGLHAISDPLEHHYMPLTVAGVAIDKGALVYLNTQIDHPVIELQREKEARGLRDTHMSVCTSGFNKMMALLEDAVVDQKGYAPYLAGEMLSMLARARYRYCDTAPLVERVNRLVGVDTQSINIHALFDTHAAALENR